MTTRQTLWPCFPLTFPYAVTAPTPSYLANDCAGLLLPPPQVFPHQRRTANGNRTRNNRKFFLDRSLFELLAAHPYLALTDQQLLGWYLRLSPEDRKIILEEGGLYQFLQRHPALELSKHHVYVKAAETNFTVNMEQGTCRNPMLRSHLSVTQDQSVYFRHTNISPLHSESSTFPECYRVGSIQRDGAESNNGSSSQSAERKDFNCPLRLVEANNTKEQAVDDFHSITEDDKSFLVCLASSSQKSHSGLVTTNGEALAASCERKSERPVIERNTAEKSTSPLPCVRTCDIMLGTEQTPCVSAFTQTDDPRTADKHIVTEVHMADLDYLAAEFMELKTSQEELKKMVKRSGCKLRKKCDCIQRAQRAELSLLTLQYYMCRQHCWRFYYASAEAEQLTPLSGDLNTHWPKEPPANILNVLQKLKSDFIEMRGKILEGVPLEKLKPLSVDSGKITRAVSSYIPAQIAGDLLQNFRSWSSQEPQRQTTSGDRNECSGDEVTNDCQSKAKQVKPNSKMRTAVTLLPQSRGANYDPYRLSGNQTTAVCKDPTTREAWYDAQEDLEAIGPAAAVEMESANEDAESSVHQFSTLTRNMLKRDAMCSSEKYHTSEVSLPAINNDLRSHPAEVEEGELQGLTLNMEHKVHRNSGGRRSRSSSSLSVSSQDDTKGQTPKTDTNSIMKTPRFGTSIKNMKTVCNLPTPKGTFVPQHYGTMGSFDTLMAELTQHHPDVGRQKIVDALVELRDKHEGVLSRLPLGTISEMASELLTRSASSTQL